MNRPQVFSGEIPRSYDFLNGWRDSQIGIGFVACDSFGGSIHSATFGTSPLLGLDATGAKGGISSGLTGSATFGLQALVNGFDYVSSTGTLFNVVLGEGSVYCFAESDAIGNILNGGGTPTGYGDIAADNDTVVHECIAPEDQEIQIVSSAPAAGSRTWYLIQATPVQVDTTDSDDPNFSASGGTVPSSAILPYYNSANPQQPLAGPGGTNPPTSQQSAREDQVTLTVKTVTIASTVSTIPNALTVDAGAIPLYVGYVKNGDTSVLSAQMFVAGVGSCPTYTSASTFPAAPFLRGLTEQHHLGIAGSAPKIDGGKEWLPLSAVSNNNQPLNNLASVTLTAGVFGVNSGGTVSSVDGTATAGNYGVSSTLASNNQGSLTTTTTLINAYTAPAATTLVRVHVAAETTAASASAPTLTLTYTTPGGTSVSTSSITMTAVATSGSLGEYTYSATILVKASTTVTVAVTPTGGTTVDAWAVLQAIA